VLLADPVLLADIISPPIRLHTLVTG